MTHPKRSDIIVADFRTEREWRNRVNCVLDSTEPAITPVLLL
jgi:hypothetical protein